MGRSEHGARSTEVGWVGGGLGEGWVSSEVISFLHDSGESPDTYNKTKTC